MVEDFQPRSVLGNQPFRGPVRSSPALLPFHLHQQPICHEFEIHSSRFAAEDHHIGNAGHMGQSGEKREPRMDDNTFFVVHSAQHSGHGNSPAQGNVWKFFG